MLKKRIIFSSIFVVFLVLSFIVAFRSGIRHQAAPGPQEEEQTEINEQEVKSFEGTAEGYGGELVVEITLENDEITGVEVLEHSETDGVSDPAFEEIPSRIIEEQSYEVDIASGATVTSQAIMEAVADALN